MLTKQHLNQNYQNNITSGWVGIVDDLTLARGRILARRLELQ